MSAALRKSDPMINMVIFFEPAAAPPAFSFLVFHGDLYVITRHTNAIGYFYSMAPSRRSSLTSSPFFVWLCFYSFSARPFFCGRHFFWIFFAPSGRAL
jgi:hypothetical protein